MSILALAIATLAMTQSSSATIEAREADRLEACVAKIEVDAEEAYEDGLAWIYQGNRPGARQCTAMALIALGRAWNSSPIRSMAGRSSSAPNISPSPATPGFRLARRRQPS